MTLLDVSITTLIIGILAASVTPRLASVLHHNRAELAAKQIQADLTLARNLAVASSSPQTVQFDPATESYTIAGYDNPDRVGQTYSVNLTLYPYQAQMVSASLGGDSDVVFDIYGIPDSGGTITVQSASYQQTVTVNIETGKATIP